MDLDTLVERADLDDLVRAVDGLCANRDWPALVTLRDRCIGALATGRQLWPIASLCEYRVALLAPGDWAARMIVEGTGRFALGPLAEVVASTHTWDELAPHLPDGPLRSFVAHERVVRGEVLGHDERIDSRVLDTPLALCPWEPAYALATYHENGAEFPTPSSGAANYESIALPHASPESADAAIEALADVARVWASESNGRVEVVAVDGTAAHALGALGLERARIAPLDAGAAMAWLAWAAASGGAHGRRRGAALGRFGAWWALAALTGLDEPWPPDARELGSAARELRWFQWDALEPATGWQLRLAIDDPADGVAWAINASDS